MEENLSQTKKARAARKWRKQTSQRKRFEGTMKEFLKVKYSTIYNEYVEFYNLLDERYPNVRELSKTPRFKKWAKTIQQEQQSSQSESEDNQSKDSAEIQPTVSCQDEAIPNQVQQQASQEDVLSAALRGIIPPQIDQVPFDDLEDIINELEQDISVQHLNGNAFLKNL